jgi:four helix bundle protein
MNEPNDKNLIVELTFQFALKVIEFIDTLEQNRKYIVARQLLKSGTSIGANVREAQNAESRWDFIHKLKIAAKEADETVCWLLLCKNSKGYNNNCDDLIANCNSISKILSKIIVSAKRNGYRT